MTPVVMLTPYERTQAPRLTDELRLRLLRHALRYWLLIAMAHKQGWGPETNHGRAIYRACAVAAIRELHAAGFDAVRCVRAWHAALEGEL